MDASWMFSVLGTVAASGVTSALVSYWLNLKKDQNIFMRQKAEELYRAFERYDHVLGGHFLPYFSVLRGEQDYNSFLDEQLKRNSKETGSKQALSETQMLIGIYFPRLEASLSEYLKCRDELNSFLLLHKRKYKANALGEDIFKNWVEPFSDNFLVLGKRSDKLKLSIVSEARQYIPDVNSFFNKGPVSLKAEV